MKDADIYKEVAEAAVEQICITGVVMGEIVIRKPTIYVAYRNDNPRSFEAVAEHKDLAECVRLARAKLAAERDAKDAPKLREERDKFKAALEKIRDGKILFCEVYDHIREVLKESP